MVSLRCKLQVKQALVDFSIPFRSIEYGMVNMAKDISPEQQLLLSARLRKMGFELLDDDINSVIGKIEILVAEMVRTMNKAEYRSYLSEKLNFEYSYLSGIYSQVMGISLDLYSTIIRVELAKELLLYHDFNVGRIVKELHYNSPKTLADQFKKITGLTPAYFKKLRIQRQTIQKNQKALTDDRTNSIL